jgi:hypothetical protein
MTTYTTPPCMHCGKISTFAVESTALYRWQTMGAMIQDAFPDMSAAKREHLKTGTHPECWNAMFGTEEYEDEDEDEGEEVTPPEPRYCEAVLIRETRIDPAEYCEEEAEEDSEFCAKHADHSDEYEPDDREYDYPDEHDDRL